MKSNYNQLHPTDDVCSEGILPACAPLAVPFVPFQTEQPVQYDADFGLVRGTLFPGLDLPFKNMSNTLDKPNTLIIQLQAMYFAVTELSLYLDTHPEDEEAIQVYHAYQDLYVKIREQFQQECHPLDHISPLGETYSWIEDPWPWEYCANREE